MKVLFVGGTGNISTAVSRLVVEKGVDLYHLNRGKRKVELKGVKTIIADISDAKAAAAALEGHSWDAVVNWIGFTPDDMQRDIALFSGRTKQYIFISSASVYQKPLVHPSVTESTPLCNPFWDYSNNKILSEECLNKAYREHGFPITIVRPSLTYDTVFPVAIGSWNDFTLVDRIRRGGKIIVHGDGTSLWTVTHSDDFAKGFAGLLGNPQTLGHAFHITSDEILTWNQIYSILANAAGAEPKLVHIPSDFIAAIDAWQRGNLHGDKAVSAIFDNTKIKTFVPSFKATIPFHEGIRRTIAWFEADKSRMRVVDDTNKNMDRIIAAYEKGFPK
ncbi:NAD-dependent epimerase/dehydratase family protein [bacterium]|nr:NAD-dependent epimerase/dehydratase family protein [bacterium]